MCRAILWCLLILPVTVFAQPRNNGAVPKDLPFGVSTSAFQFEGAWNIDGKGESIWDTFSHQIPSPIMNNDTADIACNTYYRYKEDVRLAAELGVKMYRFSISWPRVLPTGYSNKINQKGIDYYKNVVDEIIKYNMTPVATLYHWDLPQKLYDDGIDWTTTKIIPHFVNYSRIVIKNLPKVGIWGTINEPQQVCRAGYGSGIFAPGLHSDGLLEYQCTYVSVKAHAAVYRMYKKEFPSYTAKMSISVDCQWIEPVSDSPDDIEAADRQLQFECGLYFHPIFKGGWPKVVEQRIRDRSLAAGFKQSRLPAFTKQEIKEINGTHDFLGLNHYFTKLADDTAEAPANETSFENDMGVITSFDPHWIVQSNGLFVTVPFGLRKVILWITKQYGPIDILITEVGMCENGTSLNDVDRIAFYNDYFCNILQAMHEGARVTGITMWSLLDDFEWFFGYSAHFGLYHIDHKDPNLTRKPKESVKFIKKLVKTRQLSCDKPSKNWLKPMRLPPLHKFPRNQHFPRGRPHLPPGLANFPPGRHHPKFFE